ncbi:MAG: hypothetical protein MUE96_08100 [Bacteroidia bacterium]|jgi:hypothetical protein|nr:hypothetical protein [Bacteroidia bacterium]
MLLIVQCWGQSSDASKDLRELSDRLNKRRYTYTLTYTLYDSYTGIKPVETQVMNVKMWDLMIHIQNSSFEVIKNKNHYLYADLANKVIMINNVNNYASDNKELKELEAFIDMDTLLSNYKKVSKLNPSNPSLSGYRLQLHEDNDYAYLDILINTKTRDVHKIILYAAKDLTELIGESPTLSKSKSPPRLEMLFTEFTVSTRFKSEWFSVGKFVAVNGKKAKVEPMYKDFKFINNIY